MQQVSQLFTHLRLLFTTQTRWHTFIYCFDQWRRTLFCLVFVRPLCCPLIGISFFVFTSLLCLLITFVCAEDMFWYTWYGSWVLCCSNGGQHIIFCQALEVFTINSPIVEGSAAGVMARNKVPPRPLSRAEWTWLTAAHNRIEKGQRVTWCWHLRKPSFSKCSCHLWQRHLCHVLSCEACTFMWQKCSQAF